MAYSVACDETIRKFDDAFSQSSLNQVVTFKVIHNSKMKINPLGLCGKVSKTKEIVQIAVSENYSGVPDFVIEINDDVFVRLSHQSQDIVVDKLLAQIRFDFEKDKSMLVAPDVQEFSGILKKYSWDKLEAAKMEAQTAYQVLGGE